MTSTEKTNHIPTDRPRQAGLRGLAGVALGLLLMAASYSLGADEWRDPSADWRLQVTPALTASHTLRVDLPLELQERTGRVTAYLDDGIAPLSVSPVTSGQTLIAVEISLPPGVNSRGTTRRGADFERSPPLPLALYLHKQAVNAAPIPGRTPVAIHTEPASMVARPHHGQEMLQLAAKRTPLPFVMSHNALNVPQEMTLQRHSHGARGHDLIQTQLTTLLRVDADTSVRLGAEHGRCAWFLFIDGKLAAGWKEATAMGDSALLGETQTLKAGRLHRLDFYTLERRSEEAPGVVWQPADGPIAPIPLKHLVSPLMPAVIRVENRAGSWLAELRMPVLDCLSFPARDSQLLTATLPPARNPLTPGGTVTLGGTEMRDGVPVTVAGRRLPGLALAPPQPPPEGTPSRMTFAAEPVVFPTQIGKPRVIVEELPVTAWRGGTCTVRCRVGNLPAGLVRTGTTTPARLHWEIQSGSGTILASGQGAISGPEHEATLDFEILPGATDIQIECQVDDLPVTPTTRIRFVDPTDSMRRLTAIGDRVHLAGQPAILIPRRPSTAAASTTDDDTHRRSIRQVALVDEFIAAAHAPGVAVAPEEELRKALGVDVILHSTGKIRATTTVNDLRKFSLLGQITETPADAVVWAVGMTDLRAAHSLDEFTRRIAFLIQTTQCRDAVPILMTMPPATDVAPEAARQAALMLKTMALTQGIPIVDAYAQAMAPTHAAARMENFRKNGEAELPKGTLNDDGRRWMASRVARTLLDTNALQEENR